MSRVLRVVTTLVIQDQRPVFCNILPYSAFPRGLPDGRYALVLQSDVVIPVTDESSGSNGEQAHTMSANQEDMERARFEEVCLNCWGGDVAVGQTPRHVRARRR